MLNYEQYYNWCNNNYDYDTLYKVYRNGFLMGLGFYAGAEMRTLETSNCLLKYVTFIKRQRYAFDFRYTLDDKIDETYELIPVSVNDARLVSSAIQLISDRLVHDKGYAKGYECWMEMINKYAEVIEDLSNTKMVTSVIKQLQFINETSKTKL